MKLLRDFFERANVVEIARELLGKELHTLVDGQKTVARISEVEAYAGRDDKACHANDGLRSHRTEVMYGKGGVAYVYLCYGIHHLFNAVTNQEGQADAVLVRAVEPVEGVEVMLQRRKKAKSDKTLTSGPGTLSQAMGIRVKPHYGADLLGDVIWIEDAPLIAASETIVSRRIGVDYAEEDALKPWRFYLKDSIWVSKRLEDDQPLG